MTILPLPGEQMSNFSFLNRCKTLLLKKKDLQSKRIFLLQKVLNFIDLEVIKVTETFL